MKKQILCILLLAVCIFCSACADTNTGKPTEMPTDTIESGLPTDQPTDSTDSGLPTEQPTDTVDFGSPTEQPTETNPGFETFESGVERIGDQLTVKVSFPNSSNEHVSIIVLNGREYVDSWLDNPENLINMEQFMLDDTGKGKITLYVPNELETVTVCVTTQGNRAMTIYEVKKHERK